jgi:uracil-DNA glycosylase
MNETPTAVQTSFLEQDAVPAEKSDALEQVRAAARECQACPLWEIGTQTVFGTGDHDAPLTFIGEAPGEHEDRQGVPFVGPAGRLFDEALAHAGLLRERLWVTNVVKHRPWDWQGRRKKNRAPKAGEIKACLPWLEQELRLLKPRIVVCVGATAAKAVLGKDFRLTQQRGSWLQTDTLPNVLATIHPAYVLIQPEESYDRIRDTLFSDVQLVADRCRELGLHSVLLAP